MIRIELKGTIGYAVSPAIEEPLVSQILFNMPARSRIGIVDLALTRPIGVMIREALAMGHQLVLVKTEHMPFTRAEQRLAVTLRKHLGRAAQIVSRRLAPSSTQMVGLGEFNQAECNVVWFHANCMDGFLAFTRGAGLSYSGAVLDANLLDSGHRGMHLSPPTRLLVDAVSSLVLPYNVWPHQHEQTWYDIADAMIKVMSVGGDVSSVDTFRRDVSRALTLSKRSASVAADRARRWPGHIGLSDLRSYLEAGLVVHRNAWRWKVRRRMGDVFFSAVVPNPRYDLVHVDRPHAWPEVDLMRYLPPGVSGHAPYRVRVPLPRLGEFQDRVIQKGITGLGPG